MRQRAAALALALVLSCAGAAPRYCLRAENGLAAAFDVRTGARLPLPDTPLGALRAADRAMLENGLVFGTFPELTRACEDLCS